MMKIAGFSFLFFSLCILLISCKVSCSVGDAEPSGTPVLNNGTRLFNDIELMQQGVKVKRAYLILEGGDRVPDDNFVDFSRPIKLVVIVDSGWVVQDGRVWLGASEAVIAEDGDTLLNEKDLFSKEQSGLAAADAKIIGLSFTFRIKPNIHPTSFTIPFKIWDKNGSGYIEGSYKIFSR